jgi:DNA-binding CsgD family transcriptional regulator
MKKKKSDEEHALPSLSLVFGYIAVKELQRTEDRVAVLTRLGYGVQEIATICDTTAPSVRTFRSLAKKHKSTRRPK